MHFKDFIMRFMFFVVLSFITTSITTAKEIIPKEKKETGLNLLFTDASITSIFEALSQQTGYSFFYDESYLSDLNNVTIRLENASLKQALDQIAKQTELRFRKVDDTYTVIPPLEETKNLPKSKQGITVTGTVTDAFGEVMPGVNVVVQGTTHGTTADINGEFSITVPSEGTILVFSFVGYEQQSIAVGQRRILAVKLVEAKTELDEVVVVGYGKQKKVSVTGALSQITAKDVIKVSTPNMANAIAGKMPGIITRQSSGEPGYDAAQVYIRGLATFGNTSPLILIDGVERDMNQINAQEVESFTVLKDASATAVYGARGATGVILITTKRGKTQKPTVILRSEFATLHALRLPEYINGQDYAMLMNEAKSYNGKSAQWTKDEIKKFGDGSDPYMYPSVDWTDETLKKNTMQTINNLSVTGGGDVIRYYMNVGYTVQEGIYKEDPQNKYDTNAKINRYNFRSNIDVNLTKSLVLQLGLGGIIQTGNYPGYSADDIFAAIRTISPIAYPVHNPDGSLGGAQSYVGWNPYGRVTQSGYSTQDRVTLQGSFSANWDMSFLVKGLSVRGLFAYDRYSRTDNNRPKQFGVKRYLGKDPVTGEDQYSQWFQEEKPMSYEVANEGNRAMYLEAQINYDRTFAEKHNVTGMLLFNQREYIDLCFIDDAKNTSLNNIPYRRRGYAGRFTYSYDNRYLAEVNFGYNGSENFPENKRYGFFPSASVGWIVSNEDFFKNDVVNHFKLRGSFGKVGNDQIGQRFIFMNTVESNGVPYFFGDQQIEWTGMQENLIGNPNVTWEESTKTDIGFDLGLWKDKVTLQVDVFNEYRKNILVQRQTIPQVSGIFPWSVPWANLGKVKNKGIDALLEVRNTTESGIFYSFQGNFTFARNKVIENDEPAKMYPYMSGKGQRVGQYFAFVDDGFFKDQTDIETSAYQTLGEVRSGDVKYKDINSDGKIDSYDMLPVGYARTPEISFGFGGTVGYKGFDVSLFFTGAANTSVNIAGIGMWPFYDGLGANNILTEYYDNRWTPENPNAKYPAVDEGNNPNNFVQSTIWMKNGNYLRLRNAEIGYTIPEKWLGKYNFGNIRFFVNGMNLYTWDHIKIMDPESNDGIGGYPLQRSFNVGVQVDFK